MKSYFVSGIAEVRSPLIAKIVDDAVAIKTEETESVLEALILEAKRIKQYEPVGNTVQKDNKSWSYLVITNEKFPRVLVARERELNTKFSSAIIKELFGPFPSVGTLREALKIVRKIFPFFDTPFPLDSTFSKAHEKTVRFNQSIGLYPKECNEKEYKKTIRAIIDLFSGRKQTLIRRLEKEMHRAAKQEEFEKAHVLKRQVFALQHIQDITLIKDELRAPTTATFRVEAYDVAHLRGEAPRGVMTVIIDGEPVTSEYRTFTIRSAAPGDDYAALDEVITRRAKHTEWPFPQLVVIDGGRGHLNRAKKTLTDNGVTAPVVSVVKDEKHRPREILGSPKIVHTHEASILRANNEAHRFAIGKHRKALRKRRFS
ncbi:MAG: UvrB/UvrC motif-containing protein [Patescibacteria group bacterium UBA2163]